MIRKCTIQVFVGSVLGLALAGCAGSDGKDGATGATGTMGADGATGPQGDPGDIGPAGPTGPAGMDGDPGATGPTGPAGADGTNGDGGTNVSCLSPCHGFGGVVEQWKTSTHYSTYISNLGGDEVATWTGATACGNCHAIDAIQQRVAGNVAFVGTAGPANVMHGELGYLASTTNRLAESTYLGQATVAVVHCSTCHDTSAANDPHLTGNNYTDGSFPLRVPTGADDQTYIEKSSALGMSGGTPAGKYNRGNVCIWCHRSRKDVSNYVLASNNLTSTYWGPHEGPQSDIYTGLGGYHYGNQVYRNSTHQGFTNGCIECHMPQVTANQGVGNHSFYAQLSACSKAGCHLNATSFDVGGGQSAISAGIQELRVALNTAGWLTRSAAAPYVELQPTELADRNFSTDLVRPGATGLTADQAGALYNYLIIARGSALGAHNPLYVRELIYDSVVAVTGNPPVTIPTRP